MLCTSHYNNPEYSNKYILLCVCTCIGSSGEVTFDDLFCPIHDIEPYPLSLTVNATSTLSEVSLIVRKFYMGKPTVCHYHPMLQACGDVCFLDCPYAAEKLYLASADYFKEAPQVPRFSFSGVASDFICYELTGSLKDQSNRPITDVHAMNTCNNVYYNV